MLGWLDKLREMRWIVVVIVGIALFLDHMLLTVVVPIIPSFLYEIEHPVEILSVPKTTNITTTFQLNIDNFPTDIIKTNITYSEPFLKEQRVHHKDEAIRVGIMFASKAFVQIITSPFVAILTNKIGYNIPFLMGLFIMFVSTSTFAFGRTYFVLFAARAVQGVGSCCSTVAGMGMLAERYPEDKERGKVMGIALGGLALGVMVGPPFGGIMYQYVSKPSPFIILAMVALIDGLFQLLLLRPKIVKQEKKPQLIKGLITDPHVLLAAGAIIFANSGIAVLEPTLPFWMIDKMEASRFQTGAIFLSPSISYLIGTNLFGPLGHWMGRWLAALLGVTVLGISAICIPLATNIYHLIPPMAGIGFSIGMVDSSMLPHLAYLVDIRHSGSYGNVYSIGDIALCLAYSIGPAFSGILVKSIGFEWMIILIGLLNFLYAPLLLFLRNPATKDENTAIRTATRLTPDKI